MAGSTYGTYTGKWRVSQALTGLDLTHMNLRLWCRGTLHLPFSQPLGLGTWEKSSRRILVQAKGFMEELLSGHLWKMV